jgi:NAD(P)-dependent dehydrogenase (short-subunit alcohol dehydrogenase family)
MGINLDGVFHGLKALLPRMRVGGGAITVTASIAGFVTLPIDPLYAASKYGLIGLTRAVAAANAEGKLRINAICPGVVDTQIVPEALRAQGVDAMPATVMAAEIVDLLRTGPNGEIRVKLTKDLPGFGVVPQDLQVLARG